MVKHFREPPFSITVAVLQAMIKAVEKKLKKLWAKKKRSRKRSNIHEPYYHYYPPPPPACHCCCSYPSTPAPQPSAPPLPPWLEPELTISAPGADPLPELAHPSQTQLQFPSHQEIVVETSPIYPALPVGTPSSYQQYTVPNPVYGVPVGLTPRKKKLGGFFGCFVKFGVNLIRCFCPCFRIQEVSAPVVA